MTMALYDGVHVAQVTVRETIRSPWVTKLHLQLYRINEVEIEKIMSIV
jgi:hypothetical protein